METSAGVVLALRSVKTRLNDTRIWLLAKTAGTEIYSVDLKFNCNAARKIKSIRTGRFSQTLAMSSNTNEAEVVRVGLAGAFPVHGVGGLLAFTIPISETASVELANATINEGGIPVHIDPDGSVFDNDTDGDGQTDWDEVRAGTDPNDRHDLFGFHFVKVNPNGTITIAWSSVPGNQYQLWCSESEPGARWRAVGGIRTAIKAETTVVDRAPVGVSARLYRVQIVE